MKEPSNGIPARYAFASDNTAGICPEAMAALVEVNGQPAAASYGDDAFTQRACDAIRQLFEHDAEIFFCFNGTAANAMAIAHLCQSYHSVICTDVAHVETDECGAPEFFSNGTKVLTAPSVEGKMTPDALVHLCERRTDIHYPRPRVLSLTQATEAGTVYTVGELAALHAAARRHGLRIHMDGARFANAWAALGVSPAEFTWKVGVDVLCFGGTKNGMPVGEAVVFFDRTLAREFDYRCKQAGQLASKMRFVSAPWLGMLSAGAVLKNAQRANAMARRLGDGLAALGVEPLFPVQANAVFVRLPNAVAAELRGRGWRFYDFIAVSAARFMCSWRTTEGEVDALLTDVADVSQGAVSTPCR